MGFPGSSAGKESVSSVGDPGSIPGLGSSLGKEIGYPLQHSWSSPVIQTAKESASNEGDLGLISGLEKSPGGSQGNPLQDSCLENPRTGQPGEL